MTLLPKRTLDFASWFPHYERPSDWKRQQDDSRRGDADRTLKFEYGRHRIPWWALEYPDDVQELISALRVLMQDMVAAPKPAYMAAWCALTAGEMQRVSPSPETMAALRVFLREAVSERNKVFGDKLELGLLSICAGLYDDVPRWVGGGALPKSIQAGRTYPWEPEKFVRALAVTAKERLSPALIEPAWRAFLESAPRECYLQHMSHETVDVAAWAYVQGALGVTPVDVGPRIVEVLAPFRGPPQPFPRRAEPSGINPPPRGEPQVPSWAALQEPEQQNVLARMLKEQDLFTWDTKWGLADLVVAMKTRPRDALLSAIAFGVEQVRDDLFLSGVRLFHRLRVFDGRKGLAQARSCSTLGAYSLLAVVRSVIPADSLPPGRWLTNVRWLDIIMEYAGPLLPEDFSTIAIAAYAERGMLGLKYAMSRPWWGTVIDHRIVPATFDSPPMIEVRNLFDALEKEGSSWRILFESLVRRWPTMVGNGVSWRDLIWVARAALVRGARLPEHHVLSGLVEIAQSAGPVGCRL